MMKKLFLLSVAFLMGAMTFTSCSSNDDDNKSGDTSKYSNKMYGQDAISKCELLITQLKAANTAIGTAQLTSDQDKFLRNILTGVVNNVIIPTYTDLANDVEDLEKTLNGLTTSTITQAQIDKACTDFKKARQHWERSEAFLMGAASDFSIDPTIDSWPLDRKELLDYFKGGMKAEIEDESSILGFHALEFILFRNGQNRKVAELQGNDTYKNFEGVSGADELKYAQQVCKLLKERCFQLQVAWEGKTSANANRVSVVEKAGLDYVTEKGLSYGDNLINAGVSGKNSTFPNIQAAISQVLSNNEGSCLAIANEVGSAKILNPFQNGDIAYVESPYSYNSITDFQDNIRSIRNVWYGSTDGNAASISFNNFFSSVNPTLNTAVVNAFTNAINAIGNMPAPFVKYCSVIWNKDFDDPTNWDSTSGE
ncbi:MAG: imelysin [Prevotella sp.]|nr:imelysin [Prevotella sp.]MBQ1702804.1 imelysin [Prevotella sp.]MBQ2169742.1 imelysin [Prevotella sp.]MBQ2215534.1 imelysin [Prevotella sp.]MBQ2523046.1 imelysin [Prevotella sp.]